MPRHRQPREIAELKGAHHKNPQRYRGDVVKSEQPLGNAPGHMSEDAKSVWFELETYSLPGVLTGADRIVMEMLSNLIAECRRDPDAFSSAKHGVVAKHLATLGMTPSARQQFVKDKSSTDNPFADL
jgi:hypothetical protein